MKTPTVDEIRQRYVKRNSMLAFVKDCDIVPSSAWEMHNDIAWLLVEIEQLQEEIRNLMIDGHIHYESEE
jgi:hypothetical protein